MFPIAKRILWLPVLLLVAVLQVSKTPLQQPHQFSPPAQEPPTSADHGQPSLCSNHQVAEGRWLPITLERPPYIPLSPRVRCMRTEDFYKPFPTYFWKPHDDSCRFTDWNALRFTQLLSNQTIVFVGDSLSLEHYASLVHLLGDRARLPPKAVQNNRITRTICHNITTTKTQPHCVQVVFQTDFPLANLSTSQVLQMHPSVLILNRGAHYVPDDELRDDLQHSTLPALQEWNQQCAFQKCLLVWRTTVPGHPYCHQFTQPATSVSEMEQWILQQSTNDTTVYRKGEFHWQDFQRQNQLVVRMLETKWKALLPNIDLQIMDSYRPNILRPDYHRAYMNDCLHSCSPGGGSDLNSQWLLHMVHLWQQSWG